MSLQAMAPRLRAYWAHSKMTYNSPREREELAFLRAQLEPACRVVDPNSDIGERGSMDPYLAAVSDSDLVVISEYAGHVGKGVAEEVAQAVRNGIPAVVLRPAPPGTAPAGEFGWHVTPVGGVVVEDRNDWKVRYALLATAGAAVPAEEWFSEWLARHHDPDDTAVEFSTGGPVQFDPREGDD